MNKTWFFLLAITLILFQSVFTGCATKKALTDDTENGTTVPEEDIYIVQDVNEWMKHSRGNVDAKLGYYRIAAKGNLGSFNLSILDNDGKYVPVFSTFEEYTGTSFYLMAGKKVYKLSGGAGIHTAVRETPKGVQIAYIIPNVAQVLVDFTVFSSSQKRDGDMVKTTAVVKNLGRKAEQFALRLVMDSSIGEKSRNHFYLSDKSAIKREILFRSGSCPDWIMTGNDMTSFQILLKGADISKQDFVALANYDTLSTLNWEPSILSTKAFDTLSSYNNSAISVSWNKKDLEKENEYKEIIYFAAATYPESVNGDYFIEKYKAPVVKEKNEAEVISAEVIEENSGVKEIKENSADEVISVIEPDDSVFAEQSANSSAFTNEYIQGLLDRIAELESGASELKQDELLILNEELDAVLMHLREN